MSRYSTPQEYFHHHEPESRHRTKSAPNVSTSIHPFPFPSPPLSASPSPITYLPTQGDSDPWLERPRHTDIASREGMELSAGSVSGLEGSWRLEGEVNRRGREIQKEVMWDAREPVGLDEERKAKAPEGRALGGSGGSLGGPVGIAVMASVMDTSKGRDKVLKIAQYSLRTYLYLLNLVAGVQPLSPWFTSNSKRVRLTVSSLSLSRKCLLLLNPLHPLTHLLSPTPTSAPTLIRHLIDLTSALADDVYCMSRLGLINRRLGRAADRWANRFWFLTTLLALYTLHQRTIPRLRSSLPAQVSPAANEVVAPGSSSREMGEARWTNRKLLADLAFVSYDIFRVDWFKEPVQCAAGLLAAFISSSKIYDQHWRASLGKG